MHGWTVMCIILLLFQGVDLDAEDDDLLGD